MRPRPFLLERYLSTREFRAPHVLCASDCESLTIGELLSWEDDAAERLFALGLGYTETPGSASLRRAIAGLYETIDAGDVRVHAGAQEAIFAFMSAVLGPGDHMIVHWPAYQSLYALARAVGCEVTRWRADERNGWALDLAELRGALRPNTRAIVINCPHNPTGWLMDRASFQEVAGLAAERGIVLFSDEVYRGLEYRDADRLSAACDLDAGAVSLGVMSKTYGLPGLRIGWVATRNRRVLAAIEAQKDYTSICNSAPSEFLAELALRHRERLVARNRAIVAGNLERLSDFIERHADRIAWVPPRAGPVAFPSLRGGAAEAFCRDALDRAGVLLLPSTVFEYGDRHIRVGLGRTSAGVALDRLEAHLCGVGPSSRGAGPSATTGADSPRATPDRATPARDRTTADSPAAHRADPDAHASDPA